MSPEVTSDRLHDLPKIIAVRCGMQNLTPARLQSPASGFSLRTPLSVSPRALVLSVVSDTVP